MSPRLVVIVVALVFFAATTLANGARPDVRATWIPSLSLSSLTRNDIASLAHLGVTRLYVDVWNNGLAYFNSSTVFNRVGPAAVTSVDYLDRIAEWCADVTPPVGKSWEIFAWFEYSLLLCYADPNRTCVEPTAKPFYKFVRSQGPSSWILPGPAFHSAGFIHLDPRRDEVIAFLASMIRDVSVNYALHGAKGVRVAGAQLDDHFSCPTSYSTVCNRGVMTKAVQMLSSNLPSSVVRRAGSSGNSNSSGAVNFTLSLSPATATFAADKLAVDWLHWVGTSSVFSEYVPQIYRATFSDFSPVLHRESREFQQALESNSTSRICRSCIKFVAGVRVNGAGSPTPWSDVLRMVDAATSLVDGVSVWYSAGILKLYRHQFAQLWSNTSEGG